MAQFHPKRCDAQLHQFTNGALQRNTILELGGMAFASTARSRRLLKGLSQYQRSHNNDR
jgi:hypothetical protein